VYDVTVLLTARFMALFTRSEWHDVCECVY